MAVAFLPVQLGNNARIRVEAAWGADLAVDASNWAWSDITADVRQADGQRIAINPMGRSDWLEQAQPAECTFQLDNTSGAYSKGPQSSNYPYIRRGTPIRVSVSLNGITYFVRFFGYAYSWVPSWDTTGHLAVVTLKAAGALRRLQQGKKPVGSAARRFYSTLAPIAYWPIEDDTSSTSAAAGVAGVPPLLPTAQSDSSGVKFAQGTGRVQPAYTGFEILDVGTLPLASFGEGGRLTGTVPAQAGTPTAYAVEFIGRTYAPPVGSDVVMLQWLTPGGTFVRWQIYSRSATGGFRLSGFNAAGAETVFCGTSFQPLDLHSFRAVISVSAGTITASLRVTRVVSSGEGGSLDSSTAAGSLTWPTVVDINPNNKVVPATAISPSGNLTNDLVVGHLGVYATSAAVGITTTSTDPGTGKVISPWTGWVGESASNRLARLFAEEGGNGLPLVVVGTSTTAMGLQGADTFLSLVHECEAADQGMLFDGLTQAFTYVARSALYNQSAALILDTSAGQVGDPFSPEDDDQRNVNLATVGRKNGSSATYEDSTSPLGTAAIGPYESTTLNALNLSSDSPLLNIAGWIVRVGTTNEPYRYPTMAIDLAAVPALASAWLNTPPCARIDVTNISSKALQHPTGTVSVLLEGYTEELSPTAWLVSANCSPYSPWLVGALNNSFRLELAGQTLASGLAAGATTLSLATAAGHQLFTTTATFPADFPLDLVVGGWQIHVTSATGVASPQTLTITTSPNTATIPAGTPVTLWRPAALAL